MSRKESAGEERAQHGPYLYYWVEPTLSIGCTALLNAYWIQIIFISRRKFYWKVRPINNLWEPEFTRKGKPESDDKRLIFKMLHKGRGNISLLAFETWVYSWMCVQCLCVTFLASCFVAVDAAVLLSATGHIPHWLSGWGTPEYHQLDGHSWVMVKLASWS